METTRLLIVLGELSSDDWLYSENILSRELDQLQAEIVNLKEHLIEITTGNFFTQGNVLISSSYSIETNIIVNATVGILIHTLQSFSSSLSKCYLVYAGVCHESTGDWLLHNDLLTYDHLSSLLHPLPYLLQINGADGKESWLQGQINLCNDKKALIKIRESGLILDEKFKELAHQICFKFLTGISISDKQKRVLLSLKQDADIFEVNNFKVCISVSELVSTDNCQVYVVLGKSVLPKELNNLPCVISKMSSKLNKEVDYICRLSNIDKLFDFPKGTTTLFNQFNVGSLDLHSFADEESCVIGLVWTPCTKNAKVMRLMYVQGQDFPKFIEGVKNFSMNKVFQNVTGFCLNERSHKEQEMMGFKLPLVPVRQPKTTSSGEITRPKALITIAKSHSAASQKLDSSFSRQHIDGKSKEIKDHLQATSIAKKNKNDVKPEFKTSNVIPHKEKDLIKEKNEMNKTKLYATSNHSVKFEKPMPVKDKNIKMNQISKLDATTTSKKNGKTDLSSAGSKPAIKDVHHPTKLIKDGSQKTKITKQEVAPNKVDQKDLIEFSGVEDKGINGGLVVENEPSDQGIDTAAESIVKSDTMDTISSHGLANLTSTESSGLMVDQLNEQLVEANDLTKMNEHENHLVNGELDHKINGEMDLKLTAEGDNRVEGLKIKDDGDNDEENCDLKGGGDYLMKSEYDHNVDTVKIQRFNGEDKKNGHQMNEEGGIKEGDGINGSTDDVAENKPKIIKCAIFGPAENECGVKVESNEEHLSVSGINGEVKGIVSTNHTVDLNVSNNSTNVIDHQEDGAVDGTNDHHKTSNLMILVDLDNSKIPTNFELNENQAPPSPGYNKFVHDLEISMLTETEPVEDFLENIDQSMVENQAVEPVLMIHDDLNKVHDLTNVSMEDEVYEGKHDVTHEAAAVKPPARAKPTQNGTAKSGIITKIDKMPKKKKVPTATLR